MNVYKHLQDWYDTPRDLSNIEREWLSMLLDADLPEKDILEEQIQHSKVNGECLCGCKSINIKVDPKTRPYPFSGRVLVEMTVVEPDVAPTVFWLIVEDGYFSELEVFRADSTPIVGGVDLSNREVWVNLQ